MTQPAPVSGGNGSGGGASGGGGDADGGTLDRANGTSWCPERLLRLVEWLLWLVQLPFTTTREVWGRAQISWVVYATGSLTVMGVLGWIVSQLSGEDWPVIIEAGSLLYIAGVLAVGWAAGDEGLRRHIQCLI
ncbi:hypothetical protein ABW21_db0200026 [Orbilia brochopaga]|nr:hypothetical protein ABW21_db0200026 [Drechslerella brochopaga]